jgi:hypothetical protein
MSLGGAAPVFAGSSTSGETSAASSAAGPILQGSIRGKGVLSLTSEEGTLDFGVIARSAPGKHGHHGDFRVREESGLHYNGAIRDYSVSGSSATISGGGGLVDDSGTKHHVRFTATLTAGGPGTGAIDVTFTSKDGYHEHYAGTVKSGEITIEA